MGEIKKITCKACGESWQCMTGCGLRHGKLETAAASFREERKREILRCAQTEKFPLFDFAYRLSCCAYCKRVESVPVLELLETGTRYVGDCPVCGGEAELIEDVGRSCCPACGKTELMEEETGQWD